MKVVPPWPKPPDTATQKFAAKLCAGISPSSGNNNRWEVLKRNIRLFLLSQVVITSAAAFQRLTILVTKHPERVLRSFGVLTKDSRMGRQCSPPRIAGRRVFCECVPREARED